MKLSMFKELVYLNLLAAVAYGAGYYYGSKDEREVKESYQSPAITKASNMEAFVLWLSPAFQSKQ